MYKAAIFDLDGTLADTLESIAGTCNQCLKQVGLEPRPIDEYKAYTGDGTAALISKAIAASGDIEGKHFNQVFQGYTEMFEKNCTHKVKAYEGMKETLNALKERKIKLAVCTNKKHERAITVVEYLFGDNFFDVIIGQREGFPVKPDPDGVFTIAKQLGVEPAECVYIGDTEVDIETGNNASMCTVGVLWGFRDHEELLPYDTDALIERPEELLRYFE